MVCDSVVMFSSHFVIQMIVLLLFLFKAKQQVDFFLKFVSLLCYVFDTLIKLVCFNTKYHNLNLVLSEFLIVC